MSNKIFKLTKRKHDYVLRCRKLDLSVYDSEVEGCFGKMIQSFMALMATSNIDLAQAFINLYDAQKIQNLDTDSKNVLRFPDSQQCI